MVFKGLLETSRGLRGALRVALPTPSCPLELQYAVINRVLGVGVCITRPRPPFGLSCESNFSVRLEAIGCSRAHPRVGLKPSPALQSQSATWHFSLSSQPRGLTSRAGPLSRVVSQSLSMLDALFKCGSASRHGRGPATKEWGGNAPSSQSTQIAQQNRTTGECKARSGLCYTRPDSEDTIWQSEVRRKGVAGAARTKWRGTRHVYSSKQALNTSYHSLLADDGFVFGD